MDSAETYLSSQLIAYIGNKRRLRGFLREVFIELGGRGGRNLRFGDVFAGSGSVSRLAKSMGYGVASNDWELYSWLLNKTHIELSPSDLSRLFDDGGIDGRLEQLNSLYGVEEVTEGEAYISRHYAPTDTASADYRYERLFYTRENAIFIDNVRNTIENWYPGWELSPEDELRKAALIAPLLYQAATHANTNGVFKACHKGFGGHGSDALTRIMAEMKLQHPVLIGNLAGREYSVERQDAADFSSGRSFDICYLDPPYNQHQYGSNYFMLNTIALWDKPAVPDERKPDGSLSVKAGIRPDWVNTRSDFCYRKTAPGALKDLIEQIDARHIVLSYNTEGIIPFDQLYDILSSFGRTEIFCRDYVIYRGGKQSLGRSNRNVEFQLVMTTNEKPRVSDRTRVERILLARSIVSLMNESYNPGRLAKEFTSDNGCILLNDRNRNLNAVMDNSCRFSEIPGLVQLEELTASELTDLRAKLDFCRCIDKAEETEVLIDLIRNSGEKGSSSAVYRRHWNELLRTVRKFAFKKYRAEFEKNFSDVKQLLAAEKALKPEKGMEVIENRLDELGRVAELRMNN